MTNRLVGFGGQYAAIDVARARAVRGAGDAQTLHFDARARGHAAWDTVTNCAVLPRVKSSVAQRIFNTCGDLPPGRR